MRREGRLRIAALAIAALPAATCAQAIYKWVDEKGVTHYSSEAPPESAKAKKLDVKPPPSAKAPEDPSTWKDRAREMEIQRHNREAAEAKALEAVGQSPAQRAARCRKARAANDELLNVARLYRYDAKGERVYLTDEERDIELEATRKAIAQSCDS